MRKGILTIIAIYSVLMTGAMALAISLGRYINISLIVEASQLIKVSITLSSIVLVSSLVFVLAGVQLNKEDNKPVGYLKFLGIGFLISLISSIFLILIAFGYSKFDNSEVFNTDLSITLGIILVFTIGLTVLCSIVAIFRKRYIIESKSNNEMLDSDITNG